MVMTLKYSFNRRTSFANILLYIILYIYWTKIKLYFRFGKNNHFSDTSAGFFEKKIHPYQIQANMKKHSIITIFRNHIRFL